MPPQVCFDYWVRDNHYSDQVYSEPTVPVKIQATTLSLFFGSLMITQISSYCGFPAKVSILFNPLHLAKAFASLYLPICWVYIAKYRVFFLYDWLGERGLNAVT